MSAPNNYGNYNASKKPIDEKTAMILAKNMIESGLEVPKDIEIERIVLGTILLESDIQDDAIDLIKTPELFYEPEHQIIFDVFRSMYQADKKVDIATITTELRLKSQLENIGGAVYISMLPNRVASSVNFNEHVKTLRNFFVRRTVIKHAMRGIQDAYHAEDVHDVVSNFSLMFDEVDELMSGSKALPNAKALAMDAIERLNIRIKKSHENKITGCPTGLKKLDELTNGWQKGSLIVIGARPAMGKTAYLCYNAREASKGGWIPIIVSIEMKSEQLTDRSIQGMLPYNFPAWKFKYGKVDSTEISLIMNAADQFAHLKMVVDDRSKISVHEIKSLVRRVIKEIKKRIKEYKLSKGDNSDVTQDELNVIVLLDYLQIVDTSEQKIGVREQQVAFIARGLKAIAKELYVPVVALAQLGRATEQNAEKRPTMANLRESGALEQEADMVAFIHRPEYYGTTTDAEGNSMVGVGEIIVEKHRDGGIAKNGEIIFGYNESLTAIRDPDRDYNEMPVSNTPAPLTPNSGFLKEPKNFYEVEKEETPIVNTTTNNNEEEPF